MCNHLIKSLVCSWALLALALPQAAKSQEQLLSASEITVVDSSLLSMTLRSSDLQPGQLVPYVKSGTDILDVDASGNIWLVRQGRREGVLAGPAKEMLYQVSPVQLNLPAAAKLDKRTSYKLTSQNDPQYAQPLEATKTGRKSVPVNSTWTSAGLQVQMEHRVYVKLPYPLKQGARYTLSLPPVVSSPSVDFSYDPQNLNSDAIHVSQIGYRADSSRKYGYLSLWAGSLGPITFAAGKPFHVIDETTGTSVFSGTVTLKKRKGERDEDGFGKNYSLADVYRLDFSGLNQQGTFHLFVEGVGRSRTFTIGGDIWGQLLTDAFRGLFMQRCGIAIENPPGVYERPRCHHGGEGSTVFTSGARLMDTGNGFLEGLDNFSLLIQLATDTPLDNGWGGYHDAGDWDRRIQHLQVTRNLLALYEDFSDYFSQLALAIPEANDGMPDIIDEALWSLDFFARLQEPDGGVRGGIESDGHPFFGEPSRLDRRKLLAYHPGIWSTYLFAATAARASRITTPFDAGRGEQYRQRALGAMQWAEAWYSQNPQQPYQVRDSRNLAAVELYALTGEPVWHDLFVETTAMTAPGTPLYLYENHDQAEAVWSYLRIPEQQSSAELRANCRQGVLSSADFMLQAQKKTGFGWLKYPWRPAVAGAFTLPYARDILWAWLLTADDKYLASVEEAMQTVHGVNPLNTSYTTGAGSRAVTHILHPDSHITGHSGPPGITALGPLDFASIGEDGPSITENYGPHIFPDLSRWPVLETFFDVQWIPLMNEFSIETMAMQLYTLGFLAAHQTTSDTPARP